MTRNAFMHILALVFFIGAFVNLCAALVALLSGESFFENVVYIFIFLYGVENWVEIDDSK